MRSLLRAVLALVLFALLACGVIGAIGALYRPNTQIPAGFVGQSLSLSGLPLRVYQRGKGRDVLFIHGSPGSLEDFTPLYGLLASRLRLTAYDRPGHGFSGDSGKYSPTDNAAVAAALLDKLDLQDVIVVGHSYGGATALALALQKPERVSGYVILDSAAYAPSRPPERIYELLAVPVLGLGCASLLGTFVAPMKIRSGLAQAYGRMPPEDFVALRTRLWATPKVSHAIALESLHARAALAAQSPRYPQITAKVAIVAQAADPARKRGAERLHRELPASTLELLSDTGHYIQFDRPREVAATIRRLAQLEDDSP
jgi:pimeloyl-ACP methyl ester carboxylesterase